MKLTLATLCTVLAAASAFAPAPSMKSCEYPVVGVRKGEISCSFERSNGLKRYEADEIQFDELIMAVKAM